SMRPDEVLELDHSMMVSEPENAPPHNPGFQPHEPEGATQGQPAPEQRGAAPSAPEPSKAGIVAPEAAAAAAASVGSLVRTLSGRSTAVHRGGPTIEDLVREEIRPILKEWLDRNLPSVVERLVRAEIERVVNRDMG
ncbi:MAG: DUF2497 domain-containing protein, partial [Acetobacteraceae bacterium]|nr:DUF2497 domain-containing protein [Acetobacteraceae bacterium]